ncbi:KPN_02809 family neutral zinc metallopeptidase [Dehalogenimonas etheniformans]|uniref:Metalloprotease n=1 Tax=Dehalogenimonas etheniformans TaxID=1536648 RepID=A0A2P5P729_9CHLR|nr:neutral zinc metallopeptidase [Dehalogenimonas etheniformans]PPD58085.1 metalloprotease [Dehalogenimonas etheniformans]QNT75264.1 neutral zinc metallopeptidase [Dehalogenimonas etheniformans]
MKTKDRRKSQNIEDRRGAPRGIVGGGIGALVILVLAALLNGGDLTGVLDIFTGQQENAPYTETPAEKELSEFVSVVLAETEDTWTTLFREQNQVYSYPFLVLYTGSVQSACGVSGASTGPFYCPGDKKVYIDLSFFNELKLKFQAPGDFAIAYVIAHEVGHHVQTLLGITQQMDALRGKLSEKEYNKYSIRFELQADYFAGVWAHYANRMNLLEPGDVDEALNAAAAVGDDRIQQNTQGYTIPDSFTHGTSAQRQGWFYKGYVYGTIKDGDTFTLSDP